jgi:hypothetical protein
MRKIKQTKLPAGRFSTWLRDIRNALAEDRGMNVPCGECDACCRSSYFIHIKPDETRTLRRIPKELLFPAPLLPNGHMVLGYDKYGRCPLLIDNKCSIYKFRPSTCRSFDCRILAATGLAVKGNDLIARQAQRWNFSFPTKRDRNLFSAVQATTSFLAKHPDCIRDNLAPRDEIRLAVLAIKVYDTFLNNNDSRITRDSDVAKNVLESYNKFEKRNRAT